MSANKTMHDRVQTFEERKKFKTGLDAVAWGNQRTIELSQEGFTLESLIVSDFGYFSCSLKFWKPT